ncbi:APC family permease [Acidothermaceae bacterium B102]|nr:APC family permease [Acidothermaceae bacterium B102]
MSSISSLPKRLFVGRPLTSNQLGETLLPIRIALPIFSSDALSSVAYATQEIVLVLSLAGLTYYHYTPWLAVAVVTLMAAVVFSYRRTVHAYPSGGGDYEVAQTNFGERAGVVVAAALLTDYIVTVAVSVAAGVEAITSAEPSLYGARTLIAVMLVLIITLLNLRGVRESGKAFALPTYAFIAAIFALIILGFVKFANGSLHDAPSAAQNPTNLKHVAGLTLLFLLLRAFASGCTALTGVEAIANGVPAFQKPKSTNAARTLLLMGTISVTMFAGITALALKTHVHYVGPTQSLLPADKDAQQTVLAQIGGTVFGGGSFAFYFLQTVTAAILVLAANTAYNGFPVLASVLARDRYLPRQLHTRGDRLVYSNGIVLLATFAALLLWYFKASTTELIELYIVGVFISFTTSQLGMVRHWTRHLKTETDPKKRRQMKSSRIVQGFGGCFTGIVLVVQLATKFTHGAWIAVTAIIIFFILMNGVRRHYDRVAIELVPSEDEDMLPSRNHAIVLVSKIHKPTLRALAYARATRPSTLVALTVQVDEDETKALQEEWERRGIPVPLVSLDSPYREITRPILSYVRNVHRESPRDVVTVFLPEYVVGRWWEHLLHNQSALRLKTRLLFTPGVMVTSVPWQLHSSARLPDPVEGPPPAQLGARWGVTATSAPPVVPTSTDGSA